MSERINARNETTMSEDRFAARHIIGNNPLVSNKIDVNAATGTTQAVTVPDGAFVYRVMLYCDTGVVSATIDVGDGDTSDRYFDGVTDIAAADAIASGLGGAVGADPVQGHYYASSDTIDVDVTATGSAGTIRVMAWYDIIDEETL